MDKIEVVMKLENICLTKGAWSILDLIMTMGGDKVEREILLGSLINSGISEMTNDLLAVQNDDLSPQEFAEKLAKKKGISVEQSIEVTNEIDKNGLSSCFKKTV